MAKDGRIGYASYQGVHNICLRVLVLLRSSLGNPGVSVSPGWKGVERELMGIYYLSLEEAWY